MEAKKRIFVSQNSHVTKIWKKKKKNTFPMEFFNEIWLKVAEHNKFRYLK